MKLWIRYEKQFNKQRLSEYFYTSKEEAIKFADANNKYTTCNLEHYPVIYIQEIEVDTDFFLINMINAYSITMARNTLLKVIDNKDSIIKFGEKIDIEQVEPILLD